jgi:hypothetical protein
MKTTTYYFPIKSANLAHYFAKGCICPTRYIENRSEDIQNKFNNQLLFSKEKFTENTNCSLEIVLNNKEENVERISENFYLFNTPLPISRIKKIIFQNNKQKVNTTFDITSGAAFLPELFEIDSNAKPINYGELENIQGKSNKDWSEKLSVFNRIMGGFSIMSIAGNEYQNYPLNYFNTLANLNIIVKDEIINQSIKVNVNYEWAIIENDNFSKLHKAIYRDIKNDVVESFALNDKIKLEKNNGKYLLEKIDNSKATYLVAVLASYGIGARMSLDTFISDLVSNKFIEKKKEGIALIMGINKGYEAFRNKYKTSNFQADIKFKLDSQLDYYTIESIFQYVFNKKTDNHKFEYIDDWCPKLIEADDVKELESYQVLDKTIFYKKKEEDGFFQKLFQNSSRNNIYQKIVLEIKKWTPSYMLDKNNTEGSNHFKNLLETNFEEYTKEIFEKVSIEIKNQSLDEILVLNKKNSELQNILKNKDKEIFKLKDDIHKLEIEQHKEFDKPDVEEFKSKVSELSIKQTDIKQDSLDVGLFTDEVISDKDIRGKELLEMGITKLRKVANEKGIKNVSKFKKKDNNFEELVDLILAVEFN